MTVASTRSPLLVDLAEMLQFLFPSRQLFEWIATANRTNGVFQ